MTSLSVITTNVTALSSGLPLSVSPDDCTWAILLGQEADSTLRVVQTNNGTLAGSGGGGSGSGTAGNAAAGVLGNAAPAYGDYLAYSSGGSLVGVSSANPLPVAGTFTLSGGGTVAVAGTVATTEPDVRGTLTVAAATANAAATVLLANGVGTVGFTVSGLTASGATLAVEGSNDGGTTWSAVNTVSAGTGTLSSALTADGQFSVAGAGRTALRLRVSAVGAGTITVVSSASVGTRDVALAAPLPPGSNNLGTITGLPYGTQTVTGTVALSAGGTTAVTGTFWQATQPVSLATLPALPAGSNAIGTVAVSGGTLAIGSVAGTVTTAPTGTQTVAGTLSQASGGTLTSIPTGTQTCTGTFALSTGQTITLGGSNSVTLAAGTSNIGTVALASSSLTLSSTTVTLAAGTSNIGTIAGSSSNLPTYLNAVSSGAASSLRTINTAGSSMATSVKASGGNVYTADVSNGTSATIYFRMFNLATAPTVGSSTPLMGALAIPAGSTWTFRHDIGLYYSTGIGFCVTTGSMADSDTGTLATANQVTVTIGYK